MTDEATPKKSNRGGHRTPGPGKSLGRPSVMEEGKSGEYYLDAETLAILPAISEKSKSDAIRIAVKFWAENH